MGLWLLFSSDRKLFKVEIVSNHAYNESNDLMIVL